MSVFETIKAHPVPVIGGGVVLALLLASRGNGNAAVMSASSVALQSQQLADQTSVQLAGINAQVQGAQITANGQNALARTAMATNIFQDAIQSQTALSLNNNNNLTQQTLASMASADNMQKVADNFQLGQQAITAGVTMNAQQVDGQIQLANIKAASDQAVLNSPNFATALQHAENINASNNATAIQLAQINNQASVIKANSNASAQSNSDSLSWVGTAATIAAMFL